jgi:CheY-like chemotaxis protein
MRPIRIVVADDDDEMRALVRLLVRPIAADIRDARSGWELLAVLADEGPFDLVITDVRMPAPSGVHVVTMAWAAGLSTPFLVITAFPDDGVRHAVDRQARTLLLGKPFDRAELLDAVARLLPDSDCQPDL